MKKINERLMAATMSAVIFMSGYVASAATMEKVELGRKTTIEAEISQFANMIDISGKVISGGGRLSLTYLVMAGDEVISVFQQRTAGGDTIENQVVLDEELCSASGSQTAVLRISGKDVNTLTAEIPLYSGADIKAALFDITDIDSQEDYEKYMKRFAGMLNLTEFTESSYSSYMAAQYELFHGEKPTPTDDMKVMKKWVLSYREKAGRVMTLMDEINAAAGTDKWGEIEKLTTETYQDLLDIDVKKSSQVSNKGMFRKMCGKSYTTRAEIAEAYDKAYEEQAAEEKNSSSNDTGTNNRRPVGGGGGGTSYRTKPVSPEPEDPEKENSDDSGQKWKDLPAVPRFNDIDEADWARNAVMELTERGVVHGNGNGNFDPMRGVTREEMLSMLLNSFRLPETESKTEFTDVTSDDWCYEAVGRGQALGLINGMPDGSFGKGQNVTRADMAVMAVRLVQLLGEELVPIRPMEVFRDFYEIPDYAKNAISVLQQAGVINGTDNGRFDPLAGSTRAEAAVLTYNLIQAIGGNK